MKFRFHRGSLADSMATLVMFEDAHDARRRIAERLRDSFDDPSIVAGDITSEPYGFDGRIGWDTHLVLMRGCPCGFADAPLTPSPAP